MDEHRHNILIILVLFHGHISSRKNRNPLYHLEMSTKSQQEERKMKRDEMKKEKNRGFGLGFTLILRCGFH